MPLEPAIHAFETLASDKVGGRAEATFSGLCHRVHCSGKEGSVLHDCVCSVSKKLTRNFVVALLVAGFLLQAI
jgi:hypothetical protein